jgi:multiple antibiotic resistance protein
MASYFTTLFSISLSLFILMNAFGNISLYVSLLKGIPKKRQTQIVTRELLIALFIIIIFNFIGQQLLNFLNIKQEIVRIAGGVVLFLLSLKMLFPPEKEKEKEISDIQATKSEPFIVPLAMPLVAGPAVLSAVMLYSQQIPTSIMLGAIFIAWILSFIILIASPYLGAKIGDKGIIAIERLMGFLLVMISIQMFLVGLKDFMLLKP